LPAVYSFMFPEVRALLGAADNLDPRLFLTSTTAVDAADMLASIGLDPPLAVPATPYGCVDLDALHEPALARLTTTLARAAPGLDSFAKVYPTSGSSTAIFHLLAEAAAARTTTIRVLDGEYEGFGEYARAVGLAVEVIDPDICDPARLVPGLWFISDPSARDGNWIGGGLIERLCDAGHRLVIDLAYLGTAGHSRVELSHPNIEAVVVSLSKPWGLFRFRVGTCYSRQPVPSLYAQRWFKDIGRLLGGLRIVEALPPGVLEQRWRPVQSAVLRRIADETGLRLRPSAVFLLANLSAHDASHLSAGQRGLIEPYARGRGYRFCLTPYFEQAEREQALVAAGA